MPLIKNVCPYGSLWIAGYDQDVDYGEIIDVPDEDAPLLLAQPFNWVAVDADGDVVETDQADESDDDGLEPAVDEPFADA